MDVRYAGVILSLLLLSGCTDSGNPATQPSAVDNQSNNSSHTVNKPVTDQSNDANSKAATTNNAANNNSSNAATPPNNTAVNERDQSDAAKTPIDQGNNQRDIKLTADIRQQIVNRSGMSINARNIKIISVDGKVTLRGPVENQAEKDLIEQMAKDTAGAANVDNQLEVKPPEQK